MRKCVECGASYCMNFRSSKSKYCSQSCVSKVRSRTQKKLRDKVKERAKNDIDFCSMETFKKYRQRSPKRGLSFSLTSKDFRDNIEKPCYYCGDSYDGIGFDRVVNTHGYHIDNIVPCCPICNRMKNSAGLRDFVDRCKRIADNHIVTK